MGVSDEILICIDLTILLIYINKFKLLILGINKSE